MIYYRCVHEGGLSISSCARPPTSSSSLLHLLFSILSCIMCDPQIGDSHGPLWHEHTAQWSGFVNTRLQIQLRSYQTQRLTSRRPREEDPIHQPQPIPSERRRTRQTGVLRSHNLTVLSSPDEMNESSAGDICKARTLLISFSPMSRSAGFQKGGGKESKRKKGYSRILMPSEVVQVFIIVH